LKEMTKENAEKILGAYMETGHTETIKENRFKFLQSLKLYPRERNILFKRPCLEALGEMANLFIKIDFQEKEQIENKITNNPESNEFDKSIFKIGMENIVRNKNHILNMIICSVLNKKPFYVWDRWRAKRLFKFLDANLTNSQLIKILNILVQFTDINSFLASMISIKGLNLMGITSTSGELKAESGKNGDLVEKSLEQESVGKT